MGWEKFYLVFFIFSSRVFISIHGVSRLDIITLSTLSFFLRSSLSTSISYLSPCVIAYWLRKAFKCVCGIRWGDKGYACDIGKEELYIW